MFSSIIDINFPNIEEMLKLDEEEVMKFLSLFSRRIFHVRQTGISSQELQSWERQGFLPYEYKETGWRKFSLVEFCWLQCILQLRSLDVSYKKIELLKKIFFDLEKREILETFDLLPLTGRLRAQKYLLVAKLKLNPDLMEKAISWIREQQISRFSFLVAEVLQSKANICLIIDEKENCKFLVWGNIEGKSQLEHHLDLSELGDRSFILINLRKIVLGFFDKEYVKDLNEFYIGFLTSREKKVLDQIRQPGVKEITVRLSESGEPGFIEVTKSRINERIISDVARYLKKGSFQEISFKTRDGELIKYSQTDIIKL